MEMGCVFCAVGTEYLHIIKMMFRLIIFQEERVFFESFLSRYFLIKLPVTMFSD
jgi:hypothetical protein